MKIIEIIVLSVLLLTGCQPVKPNKYYFDKYFKKNVSACASVFIQQNNADSAAAVNFCSCALNKLYAIDSNSVRLQGKELTESISKNRDIIFPGCDSLLLKKQ